MIASTASHMWVFTWIHTTPIKHTKVLINKRCGGFRFSAEFEKEFMKKYNQSIPQNTEARYDPRILQIVEKMGEQKSSFYLSSITIKKVPEQLIPYMYITEKYGAETIHVRIGRMYKELLHRVLDNRAIKHYDILDYEFLESMEKNLTSDGIICE